MSLKTTVTFATNGCAAVDILDARSPSAFDVVLMDLGMPVVDGFAAARAPRSMAPSLPVVALTAHARGEEQERIRASGMVDRVTKPINLDELVAAIERQLHARRDK